MGKRGPAPTPTAMLKLRGSWRGEINSDEPQPTAGEPTAPPELDGTALAVWERLAAELLAMQVLTEADGFALELLARTWARWLEAESKIDEEGSTYTAGAMQRVSPWVTISRACAAELNRLLQQFGLTPSARSRISTAVKNEAPADPLEALLKRKQSG